MRMKIKIADGNELIYAGNWDGVTQCARGQLILDAGSAGTEVYDSFADLRAAYPQASEFRVINANSREVLADDIYSYEEAVAAADESESHESQPVAEIQERCGDEAEWHTVAG